MAYSKLLTFLVFYLNVFLVALKEKMKIIVIVISAVVSSLIFGKQTDAIVISTNKRQELIIHSIISKEFESHAVSKEQGYRDKKQKTSHWISNLQPELNLFYEENVAGTIVKKDGR